MSLSTTVRLVDGNVYVTKKICNVSNSGSNSIKSVYFFFNWVSVLILKSKGTDKHSAIFLSVFAALSLTHYKVSNGHLWMVGVRMIAFLHIFPYFPFFSTMNIYVCCNQKRIFSKMQPRKIICI